MIGECWRGRGARSQAELGRDSGIGTRRLQGISPTINITVTIFMFMNVRKTSYVLRVTVEDDEDILSKAPKKFIVFHSNRTLWAILDSLNS